MSVVPTTSAGPISPVSPISLRWRKTDDVDSGGDSGVESRGASSGDAQAGWIALRPAPDDNRGFVEAQACCIECVEPPSVEPRSAGWTFRVDDEPLRAVPGRPGCWIWEPGFFAGEVTAELVGSDGRRIAAFLLDVAPDPRKIGRNLFAQMMRELWNEDPALVIGVEPATLPNGELGVRQNPWIEFARLRRYAPEFLAALAPIRARPRRALRVRRDSAPLHRARRVDRRTAAALLRSPAVALFVSHTGETPPFVPDSRLDVPIIEETLDCAANRALLALTLALLRRTAVLRESLQREVDRARDSATRTSLAARWPARKEVLDFLASQLSAAVRRPPFAQLRHPDITAAGLTAIAADPLYARAWGRGWRALRHGVDSDPATERLWVSPTWEIYERWCFLRLGRLLADALPDWHWRRRENPHRWTGAHDDCRAELRLQPTFPSRANSPSLANHTNHANPANRANPASHADEASPDGCERRWSVSRQREPDLVLTVERAGDVRFVVLDAKYRTSRTNVLDAMASAHIYQDSLRIGSQRPEASLLLIPSGGGAPWLEESAFHAEHRVGVHVLSPDGAAALPAAILDACTKPRPPTLEF